MEAKKRFKNPMALSVIGFPSFIHTACKQKDRPFHQKLRLYLIWKWTCLSKDRPFLSKDGVFIKIPCFFKTSVFLKIPRSKHRPFYQRTEFSLKFRVFSKFPCF